MVREVPSSFAGVGAEGSGGSEAGLMGFGVGGVKIETSLVEFRDSR